MWQRRVKGSSALWLVGIPAGLAIISVLISPTGLLSSLVSWDVAWTAAAACALAGTLLARRAAAPANRTRWTLLSAASGCWLAGQLAWNAFGITGFPDLVLFPGVIGVGVGKARRG